MVAAPSVNKPAPVQAKQNAPVIPFSRASRKKVQLSFTTPNTQLSASSITSLGPIEIPAAGYLRYIEIQIQATTTGNAATTAFQADGPFSVLGLISLTNAAGDSIIVPITGYQLFLVNKYGVAGVDSPYCDPRQDPNYSVTTGVGAGSGGSFYFRLRIPLEIDPRDAFCSLPNMAANKSYQLSLQFAPGSAVYSTAPTTQPTVSVTAFAHFWSQPNATNGVVQQQVAPGGVGSVSLWRLQTIPVTSGDKIMQLTNVGNVIRTMILTLRNSSGARDSADLATNHSLIVNNDVMFYQNLVGWQSDMAVGYGYTATSKDVASGLDSGVLVYHQFLEQNGRVRCDGPRDQYLPTLDATLLQYRATSFGAGASTLEVLTNEIKPVSAAALYAR